MDKPICSIPDCETKVCAWGWCERHYRRWKKWGDPLGSAPKKEDRFCSIEGCKKPHLARGYCTTHYGRWKKHGDPLHVEERKLSNRTCSIPGCDRKHMGRGWCIVHYGKWRKTGDPNFQSPDDVERFFQKVSIDEKSGCWNWTASLNVHGYGRFFLNGRVYGAHVAAEILFEEGVPEGYEVDHLCRNRRCCNPAHLDIVTHHENVIRGISPSADHYFQTHCHLGHPFDDENTYYNPDGVSRQCRACRQLAEDRRTEKRRKARAA